MNILPKKRWHVRTKENIARVRRDEAAALAAAAEVQRRSLLAEQEARTRALRNRAQAKRSNSTHSSEKPPLVQEHVNFFSQLEAGEKTAVSNQEYEAAKKRETEEYEKKIGLLTYLGQGEEEGALPWWQKPRVEPEQDFSERKKNMRERILRREDPLQLINASCSKRKLSIVASSDVKSVEKRKKKKNHRDKEKEGDKSSRLDINRLREERLKRERLEREKADKFLGISRRTDELKPESTSFDISKRQKYNSQFNPEYAKQNKLNPNTKYWMQ